MRFLYSIVTIITLSILSSCSNEYEPTTERYGSNRDWTYSKDQVKVYIDDVEQTQVKEITVVSRQLDTEGENPPFPWYETTFKVKGLVSKNKIFEIKAFADVERFEGTTTIKGVEYNVTGVYTGSPFAYYKNMGIVINLNKK